jgi:hypothetical protein
VPTPAPTNSVQFRLKKLLPGPPAAGWNTRKYLWVPVSEIG